MPKKTLNQKMQSLPHKSPSTALQKKENKAYIDDLVNTEGQGTSSGKLMARNSKRFHGNWDLALNDDNLMGRLYDMLRGGNYVDTAVMAAGIPRSVYAKWKKQGSEDLVNGVDSRYALFVDGLEAIHALSEVELTKLIYDSAINDTKLPVGACWLLERVRGHRFKQNMPTAATQANVQVNIVGVAAPDAGPDYKTWLQNKAATEAILADRPRLGKPKPVEVPVGIETLTVGAERERQAIEVDTVEIVAGDDA
jgi:hypothetical protein